MTRSVDIERNITRAINTQMAAHDPTNPAHATTMLLQLIGELDAIVVRRDQDAMIQAIHLHDAMPRIRGLVYKLGNWAEAVVNMGPDQVPENGADSCL